VTFARAFVTGFGLTLGIVAAILALSVVLGWVVRAARKTET